MERSQTKQQRIQYMFLKQRQKEARVLLAAAPVLLDRLDAIDRERGSQAREAAQHARRDIEALIKRQDIDLVSREGLILIGLRNLTALINQARPHGAPLFEIVLRYDPLDTHYGAARAAIAFEIQEMEVK